MNPVSQPTCPGVVAKHADGTAVYAIRTYGGVGGPLSDGGFYPNHSSLLYSS